MSELAVCSLVFVFYHVQQLLPGSHCACGMWSISDAHWREWIPYYC